MGRTRTALASVVKLKQQIHLAKERKKYLEEYLQKLHQSYSKGKISYSFYIETLHLHRDGKTIEKWIHYYENYILECQDLIKKSRRKLIKKNLALLIFSSVFLFLLFSLSFYIQPELTGFLVQEIPEVVTDGNATIETIQQTAVLGQPVKWIKTISLDKPSKTKIRLPIEATNISVNKITSYSEQEEALQNRTSPSQGEPSSSETKFTITGAVIEVEGEGFLSKFFRNIGKITGGAIGVETKVQEIEINDSSLKYKVEYETPAPYAIEEEIERGKRVKIIGPETVHYENVLAFTTLDESLNLKNPANVKIRWVEKDTFISPTSVQDLDGNGIYDYVEWIVPSLSTQTFEIIVITKAEHLDSNREFISDIYESVKELDDVWSEEISDGDYVRVTFEIPLTSNRDITIYPRIVSGSPRIEVYEVGSDSIIAEFTNINSNQYNKVFLTNLQESQDTFDLRIVGGSIEFDYIIDPTPAWFNTNWMLRVNITIQSSQITSTLTNFPVYVNLSDLGASFFSNSNTDCTDLRVTESDGTTETAREVVFCDTAADTGELHFLADSLSSSVDTVFWIYYNNSAAIEPAADSTFGSQNVWNIGYIALYHLQ